jgi:hypothetical protein
MRVIITFTPTHTLTRFFHPRLNGFSCFYSNLDRDAPFLLRNEQSLSEFLLILCFFCAQAAVPMGTVHCPARDQKTLRRKSAPKPLRRNAYQSATSLFAVANEIRECSQNLNPNIVVMKPAPSLS